jgi:hypothetical protein
VTGHRATSGVTAGARRSGPRPVIAPEPGPNPDRRMALGLPTRSGGRKEPVELLHPTRRVRGGLGSSCGWEGWMVSDRAGSRGVSPEPGWGGGRTRGDHAHVEHRPTQSRAAKFCPPSQNLPRESSRRSAQAAVAEAAATLGKLSEYSRLPKSGCDATIQERLRGTAALQERLRGTAALQEDGHDGEGPPGEARAGLAAYSAVPRLMNFSSRSAAFV